jgi:hypothetical protein
MPQLNLNVSRGSFYCMLSYQGNTHIYATLNLKRELARIIIEKGYVNLRSYTDSSIIFEKVVASETFIELRNELLVFCRDLEPSVFFTLIRAAKSINNRCHIVCEGDEGLNAHFQEMLEDL